MALHLRSRFYFSFCFSLLMSPFPCDFVDVADASILWDLERAVLDPVWKSRKLSLLWWPEEIISAPMLPWILCSRFKKIGTAKVWTCDFGILFLRQIHVEMFIIFTAFLLSFPFLSSFFPHSLILSNDFFFLLLPAGGIWLDKDTMGEAEGCIVSVRKRWPRTVGKSKARGVCASLIWKKREIEVGGYAIRLQVEREVKRWCCVIHSSFPFSMPMGNRQSFVWYLKVFCGAVVIFLLDIYSCW